MGASGGALSKESSKGRESATDAAPSAAPTPAPVASAPSASPTLAASERLQLRFELGPYASTAAESSAAGASFAAELAAALDLSPSQLLVREARASKAREGAAVVLLELAPDPASALDLGSLPPAAHVAQLRKLVLAATASSPRPLRATIEVQRATPPNGVLEPLVAEGEVLAARRWAKLPAVAAIVLVGAVGLGCSLLYPHALGRWRLGSGSSEFAPVAVRSSELGERLE